MAYRTFAFAAVALFALGASHASATAQRTFVASSGNDANPCTLVSPCRGFAAALAQTSGKGEIVVLDSAGYGPVSITQSVSIIAPPGVYAGISVLSYGNGVAVFGTGLKVVLRGLTINTFAGGFGVRVVSGSNDSEVLVEACEISNFDYAILVEAAATVTVIDTVVRNNFYGIHVKDGATVTVARSSILQNQDEGIMIYGSAPPALPSSIVVTDSVVAGRGPGYAANCIANNVSPVGGGSGNISVTRSTVTDCQSGIFVESGAAGTVTISNSMITRNLYGFTNSSGTFLSLGNNHVSGNMTDTTGTITTVPPL